MRTVNAFIENPNIRGYASYDNAQKKLNEVEGFMEDEPTASALIVRRESDGRYIPVIINAKLVGMLVHAGFVCWS